MRAQAPMMPFETLAPGRHRVTAVIIIVAEQNAQLIFLDARAKADVDKPRYVEMKRFVG